MINSKKDDTRYYVRFLYIIVGVYLIIDGIFSLQSGEYHTFARNGGISNVYYPPTSTIISLVSIVIGVLINVNNTVLFTKYVSKKLLRR